MRGTWQTTGGGGSGGVGLVAIIAVVIVGAIIAKPVLHAVDELVRIVLIGLAVLAGLCLAGLTVALVVRKHRRGLDGKPWGAVSAPPWQRVPASPPRPEITAGRPQELHLHLHGVSTADMAEILARQQSGKNFELPAERGGPSPNVGPSA